MRVAIAPTELTGTLDSTAEKAPHPAQLAALRIPADNRGRPQPTRPTAPPREFAYKIVGAFIVADWLVACLAIFAGLMFREWQRARPLTDPGYEPRFLLLWSMGAAAWFVWLLATRRTYEIKKLYNLSHTFRTVGKAACYWSLSIWAFVGVFRVTGFVPRVGAIYCMLALVAGFGSWRLLSYVLLMSRPVRRAACSRILVIGWNAETSQLRDAMRADPSLLGEIVGCVARRDGQFSDDVPSDLPILGDYQSLEHAIATHRINVLILSDTSSPPGEIQRLTLLCERDMVQFSLVLDYFPTLRSRLHVQTVNGVPLLGRSQLPIDQTMNRVIKRVIDIGGAMLGLLIASFVVPVFGLLVYLESPGPIIYRQRRTSRSGHSFFIYKIRSMKMNAESGTGPVWCSQQDDRRLRIGTFMRRWNIDELPQFYNVLIGDMSLVGPRPERPELIARFKDEIPSYNLRHEVRTGLTGWAQIQGLRGNTDLRKRIEADLYYIENWSVAFDLYCIVATFFRVKNAY